MTTDPTPDRIPLTHSVHYVARGLPEVPNHYGPGVLAPSEITLTYRAAPDSQLGRVHAYVAGRIWVDGAELPLMTGGLFGQHYDDGPDGWPEWLAEEARLHDPALPAAVPPTGPDAEIRRARYAAVIRKAGDTAYGNRPFVEAVAEAVIGVADTEQAGLRRERDLAIAHDRQPYPTAWAYEQACTALHAQRARAEVAEARIASIRAAALRDAVEICDEAGAVYTSQALNEHAAGAYALMERLQRKAEEAEEAAPVLLPSADRAAALLAEAARIRAHCPDHLDSNSADGSWMSCHCDVADDMLCRLAAEAPAPETQTARCERCSPAAGETEPNNIVDWPEIAYRTAQSDIDTPGCDCGHDGMGPSWHGETCEWMSIPPCDHCGRRGHSFEDCPAAVSAGVQPDEEARPGCVCTKDACPPHCPCHTDESRS